MRCLLGCVAAIVVLLALPGNSAARGVAHVEVIYGTHFRHNDRETIFISHNGFFPPALCRKKVKFWLYDGPGKKFYLGKKKAYTKPDYFVKRLPDGAKSGRGKIQGKQVCGRVRGTASDTDRITIAASGPAPKLRSDRIVGGESGEKVTDQVNIDLTKWDFHFLTVQVEYELLPDVWQQVAVLGRDQLVREARRLRGPMAGQGRRQARARRHVPVRVRVLPQRVRGLAGRVAAVHGHYRVPGP